MRRLGVVDPRKQTGDGALAAAALADQRDDLTIADHEIGVVYCMQRLAGQRTADLEVPGEAACFEQRRAHIGHRHDVTVGSCSRQRASTPCTS